MPKEIVLRYDRSVDTICIKLKECRVAEIDKSAPGIIVNYNDRGEVVGIEILRFSKMNIDIRKLITEVMESLLLAV